MTWDERVRAMLFLPGEGDVAIDVARQHIHPEDRERVAGVIEAAVRALLPFDVEFRTVSPDGLQARWLRVIARAEESAASAANVGFHGLAVDVTARKRAWLEDRRRPQAGGGSARAGRAGRQNEGRVPGHPRPRTANAAQRDPRLGQLLRKQQDYLDPAVDEALTVIERNARVQDQLVSDLLDVSRIVSGKVRLEMQMVDLAAAVRSAVDAVRPAAQAKKIGIDIALDLAIGPVRGDPNRLQQVVWNLLSNAIKFTPENGRVRIALGRNNGHAMITVADTGEGSTRASSPMSSTASRSRISPPRGVMVAWGWVFPSSAT